MLSNFHGNQHRRIYLDGIIPCINETTYLFMYLPVKRHISR